MSELHLGTFSDSLEFQSWKVNFKTEICAKFSVRSNHYALDHRSRDGKINGRSYDNAIDYRAREISATARCLMLRLRLH